MADFLDKLTVAIEGSSNPEDKKKILDGVQTSIQYYLEEATFLQHQKIGLFYRTLGDYKLAATIDNPNLDTHREKFIAQTQKYWQEFLTGNEEHSLELFDLLYFLKDSWTYLGEVPLEQKQAFVKRCFILMCEFLIKEIKTEKNKEERNKHLNLLRLNVRKANQPIKEIHMPGRRYSVDGSLQACVTQRDLGINLDHLKEECKKRDFLDDCFSDIEPLKKGGWGSLDPDQKVLIVDSILKALKMGITLEQLGIDSDTYAEVEKMQYEELLEGLEYNYVFSAILEVMKRLRENAIYIEEKERTDQAILKALERAADFYRQSPNLNLDESKRLREIEEVIEQEKRKNEN